MEMSPLPVEGLQIDHYVYNGHPVDSWHSLAYCRAFSSGAVTTCFYDLGLSGLGLDHLTFRLRCVGIDSVRLSSNKTEKFQVEIEIHVG